MVSPFLAVAVFVLVSASLSVDVDVPKTESEQVDAALSALEQDGEFKIFLALLKNHHVVSDLQSLRYLTLLAPTDSAFSKDGVRPYLDQLSHDQFVQLLEFHALPRYYPLARIVGKSIPTVASGGDDNTSFRLRVSHKGGDYTINTKVSTSSIRSEAFDAYPVIVYTIDTVLIPKDITLPPPPPPPPPVVVNPVAAEALEAIRASGDFGTLASFLDQTPDLVSQLEALESGFTFFAPPDTAFGSLSDELLSRVKSDPDLLVRLLKYHIAPEYFAPWSLGFIQDPVLTLASTSDKDFRLRLEYHGHLSESVDTGIVKSFITAVTFNRKPVAVYAMDKVLLPTEIF